MPECKTDNDPCDILPRAGEAWSVCLPFGGRIWADGNGVHANGGIAPPDGVYGKVVIADGCIVGVEPEDVPLYTGSPCAPLPGGCGGAATAAVNEPAVFALDNPAVFCEIAAGAGVTIVGNGTAEDPYIISADNGIYIRSDNHAISITGDGTRQNPITVKHKSGLATSMNGMTFDAFGHLISANTNETAGTKGIKGIVPGFGINVDTDIATGIANISVGSQVPSVPGNYQLGGYNVSLDQTGRVSSIQQNVDTGATRQTVACGTTDLQINQFGTITAIAETMNLGAGYLFTWNTAEVPEETLQVAKFTMRCPSALAGICFSDASSDGSDFLLDAQRCDKIGNLFWNSGVFMAGEHLLEITGGSGRMAVLLVAVSPMVQAW